MSRCLPIPGYYDNKTEICVICPNGCSLCQSHKYCYTCLPGYYINPQFLCGVECPFRSYLDSSTSTCLSCPYDCYTCTFEGSCTSCSNQSDFRSISDVLTRCLPNVGFYDGGLSTAENCPSVCTMCESPSFCLGCIRGYYLFNGTCDNSCPPRYF